MRISVEIFFFIFIQKHSIDVYWAPDSGLNIKLSEFHYFISCITLYNIAFNKIWRNLR